MVDKNGTTQYTYNGMYSAVERTNTGRLRYKYVYANGMLFARLDSTGRKFYYHHDALGSIIGVSDTTYAVWKSFLYDEFGDSLGAWGATSINNYRYTGQEWDGMPLQAYNLRAREYYPKVGRFLQNDPIGDKGGSLNWYLYVANNPINRLDPSGLTGCTSDEMRQESDRISKAARQVYFGNMIGIWTPGCGQSTTTNTTLLKPLVCPTKCCEINDVSGYAPIWHVWLEVRCSDCSGNQIRYTIDPYAANLIGTYGGSLPGGAGAGLIAISIISGSIFPYHPPFQRHQNICH